MRSVDDIFTTSFSLRRTEWEQGSRGPASEKMVLTSRFFEANVYEDFKCFRRQLASPCYGGDIGQFFC